MINGRFESKYVALFELKCSYDEFICQKCCVVLHLCYSVCTCHMHIETQSIDVFLRQN